MSRAELGDRDGRSSLLRFSHPRHAEWNLPDVSGIDLCARIRELHPTMPVVVCTGSTDPAELSDLLKMGVRHCFHKPVQMADLLASVEAALPCAG